MFNKCSFPFQASSSQWGWWEIIKVCNLNQKIKTYCYFRCLKAFLSETEMLKGISGEENMVISFFFLIHTSWASNGARESFVNMEVIWKNDWVWVNKHALGFGKICDNWNYQSIRVNLLKGNQKWGNPNTGDQKQVKSFIEIKEKSVRKAAPQSEAAFVGYQINHCKENNILRR